MKTYTEDQLAKLLEERRKDEISEYDVYRAEGLVLMEIKWKGGRNELLELSEIARLLDFAGGVAERDEERDVWTFTFKTASQ